MTEKIVIIGGGAAGISVAASLRKHSGKKSLDITIIEPASTHYYQPAFTLVGGGCYDFDKTYKPMRKVIPNGVTWLQTAAKEIQPEHNLVSLSNGNSIGYDYLVICPGLKLDWEAVEGLNETLGYNGVCSNYSPESVQYTWECIQKLAAGDRAYFTQAPLPFKCPGAPQKIAYLAADYLRKKGLLRHSNLHFTTPGPKMFGLDYFAKELAKVADRYGIDKHFSHKLIKVDGPAKKATFLIVAGESEGKEVTVSFDMLHATPPQRTPDFLFHSDLTNEAGYVDVQQHTMQHVTHANIFSLGDACSTANSKSAAAVRKQSPTVVENINRLIDGKALTDNYLGYGSCPLTTSRGTVMMAEFSYGGKITPTLPFIAKPREESKIMWFIKTKCLAPMYWHYMLKGYEKFIEPRANYNDDK